MILCVYITAGAASPDKSAKMASLLDSHMKGRVALADEQKERYIHHIISSPLYCHDVIIMNDGMAWNDAWRMICEYSREELEKTMASMNLSETVRRQVSIHHISQCYHII